MIIGTKHNTFSVMKGIAIIAVVMGHCTIPKIEGFIWGEHLSDFPVYTKNLVYWSPMYSIAGVAIPVF